MKIAGIHYDVITCKYYVGFPEGGGHSSREFQHQHYTRVIKYADKNYPEYFDCVSGGRIKSVAYYESKE